ncbi:SMI1/KNR4 family protein [Enterobacter sichuanensis]|uniref:SMI1/KNR4 family protein n=1 Tax=Enterobacter sichuanensis TaxID=2071710 RepID=UPI003750341F
MKEIDSLLDLFNKDSRCEVIPPNGDLPTLPASTLKYPDDILYFYRKCNGVRLFCDGNAMISFRILSKNEILQSNQIIVGEPCDDDISSSWYLIGKTDNNDYLSIDLSFERNGRCYDSNYEIHGVAGSCPIIALSFTELLTELYNSGGNDIYWKNKNHGDAYD